jgi:predicted PurR-regulated permease PerM
VTPGTGGAMLFKFVMIAAGVGLTAYLLIELRSLIAPVVVSGLLAYVCRPLVAVLERYRMPRDVAIGLLLLLFVLSSLFIVNRIQAVIPTELQATEIKVEVLHKINGRYKALMGLDESLAKGNRLYQLVHRDLDPLVDRINNELALTADERAKLLAARAGRPGAPPASDRLLDHDRANVETLKLRSQGVLGQADAAGPGRSEVVSPLVLVRNGPLVTLADILSTWLVAPLVFLFLMRDTGELKRGLLGVVSNRLFEPALTVLADLDRALGNYVRGIFLECALLGFTVALFLAIVGVPLRWAIAIGLLAAATNTVPYVGFVAAMLGGLGYVLMAEDIQPVLPIVDTENVWIWVIGAVGFAELLKNVIYGPLVLGGAVKLHPLIVVIGVFGGATLFGAVGALLAIPTIVVLKVFISSAARQIKAYGLI